MTDRRVRRATAALVAGAMLLLGACSGGEESADEYVTVEDGLGFEREGIAARQAKAENIIRDCMRDQGFDYTPVAEPVGSTLSDEEFEKQYGYGITTLYDKTEGAAGEANQQGPGSPGSAERAAYERALYGDDPTATFADAVDNGDFSRVGGCTKRATDEVFGGADVIQSLQTELDELDQRILEDPRMQEAISKWSECMQEAGHEDLSEPEEVDVVLNSRLEAIVGPPESPKPDYDQAALDALQRDELALVADDVRCENEHIADVELTVREEFEATFREENADLLGKVPQP